MTRFLSPMPLVFSTTLCVISLVFACSNCSESTATGADGDEGSGAGDTAGGGDSDAGDTSGGDDAPARPQFQTCNSAPQPTGLDTVDWEKPIITGVTTLGAAGHSAQDVVTVRDIAVDLVGKFAYGALSSDLSGERIEVWIDLCTGAYTRVGEATSDSDGRIALSMPPADLPPVGAYALYLRVMGDNTHATSTLRVLLPGTKLIIMDIDGTLTTDDMELARDVATDIFAPILGGDHVPEARAAAMDLTHRRRLEQGYVLIFITGRPYTFTDISREWLRDMNMAPGQLHVVDNVLDFTPTNDAVGAYKRDYLLFLQGLGLDVWAAYGNASTDIWAYDQAGIDKTRTFIVGSNAGADGTVDLGEGYVEHTAAIALEPGVEQPFRW